MRHIRTHRLDGTCKVTPNPRIVRGPDATVGAHQVGRAAQVVPVDRVH